MHTVSLQLAKELEENGSNIGDHYEWYYDEVDNSWNTGCCKAICNREKLTKQGWLHHAPLLTEILDELPDEVSIKKEAKYYMCRSYKRSDKNYRYAKKDKNLCDAAARLWIELKKEGYIS